jgi:hypothetical protein
MELVDSKGVVEKTTRSLEISAAIVGGRIHQIL